MFGASTFNYLQGSTEPGARAPVTLVWIRQGVKLIDTISIGILHLSERWNYFSIFFG